MSERTSARNAGRVFPISSTGDVTAFPPKTTGDESVFSQSKTKVLALFLDYKLSIKVALTKSAFISSELTNQIGHFTCEWMRQFVLYGGSSNSFPTMRTFLRTGYFEKRIEMMHSIYKLTSVTGEWKASLLQTSRVIRNANTSLKLHQKKTSAFPIRALLMMSSYCYFSPSLYFLINSF